MGNRRGLPRPVCESMYASSRLPRLLTRAQMHWDIWAPHRPVYSVAFECLGPKHVSYADLEVTCGA